MKTQKNLHLNEENIKNISLEDALQLDNQLCFALYVSSKEIIRKYKPILDPLGLTYTSYITLLALWEEDEVTVKNLGKKLYLDSGTLTPLLKKLETLEYIERIRSSNDERNVYIKLTKKGENLKKEAVNIPKDLVCSTNLNPDNIKQLLSYLHQFMNDIDCNH